MSVPLRWTPEVAPEPSYAPPKRGLRRRQGRHRARRFLMLSALAACAGILSLAVIGAGSLLRSWRAEPSLRLAASEAPGRQILLLTANADRRLGFVSITGSVLSREARPLSKVEAVVELLDKEQTPLRLESALLSGDLRPKADPTPFRVDLPDDPRAVAYRIRFKQLTGAFLN